MIDKETLEELYINQHLSSYRIAEITGVCKPKVLELLHTYEIPLRGKGRGLEAKGKPVPSKEELERLVYEEYLSYDQIGQRYGGVHRNAVMYWMRKYDIPGPSLTHSRRKGLVLPSKEEILQMYATGMSLTAIAHERGIPYEALYYFCHKEGMELRKDGFDGGRRFPCNDGHIVRSIYEQRIDDWLSEHEIPHEVEPLLPFDRRYRADFLAHGWYIEIWGIRKNKLYLERKARKLEQYRQHQLPLIQLQEHDFDTRRKKPWAHKLKLHFLG